MKNTIKKPVLVIVTLLVICSVAIFYDGYFWTNHKTIKGRVIQLTDAQGQNGSSWALENQPFSWDLVIVLQGLPSALKQDGVMIQCKVVSMDTSDNNPGIDGYAMVNNCERK